MSKYTCACGYVMNLLQGWSDYEFILIPELTIEALGDRLDSENKLSSDQLYEALDEKAITVYRCPRCGRLHLEKDPNKFITYIAE